MTYYNQYKIINFTGGIYPNLYLVDDFGEVGDEEVSLSLSISLSSHGNKTLETIKSIANHRVRLNLYKSNIIRNYDSLYPSKNIIEALFSILILNTLKSGDVLIANVETESRVSLSSLNQNSIITDVVCKDILLQLSKIGVVVIVPAGNLSGLIANEHFNGIGNIIVVGSFNSSTLQTHNRYNQVLTCFSENNIPIGGGFTDTSAATAQIAGFVMQMQKYAKLRGRFLTPTEVKVILQSCGDKKNIIASTTTLTNCNIPTWALVSEKINRIIPLRIGPPAP